MIKFNVKHNLRNIQDKISNIPNDMQEAISRTFTDYNQEMLEELISRFGENLRYSEMQLVFSGSSFSIKFSNVNEYALRDRSGADAQDVADYAVELLQDRIIKSLKDNSFYRGQLWQLQQWLFMT